MGVALGAADGQAEPDGAGGVDPVDDGGDAVFLRIDAPLAVGQGVAVEAGGGLLGERGLGQQVAGELLDGELVERHVAVEGVDDPVAIAVRRRGGGSPSRSRRCRRSGPGRASAAPSARRSGARPAGGRPAPHRRRVGRRRRTPRPPPGSGAGRSGRGSGGGSAFAGRPRGTGRSPRPPAGPGRRHRSGCGPRIPARPPAARAGPGPGTPSGRSRRPTGPGCRPTRASRRRRRSRRGSDRPPRPRAGPVGGHPVERLVGADPVEQLARFAVAGGDDRAGVAAGEEVLRVVEPEPGLLLLRPVAGDAVPVEDRPDVAGEVHVLGPRGRRREGQQRDPEGPQAGGRGSRIGRPPALSNRFDRAVFVGIRRPGSAGWARFGRGRSGGGITLQCVKTRPRCQTTFQGRRPAPGRKKGDMAKDLASRRDRPRRPSILCHVPVFPTRIRNPRRGRSGRGAVAGGLRSMQPPPVGSILSGCNGRRD